MAMVAGEFVALLKNDTWPLKEPAAVGVAFTLADAVAAGPNVSGSVRPVTVNTVAEELVELIVTLLVPVFVNVTN